MQTRPVGIHASLALLAICLAGSNCFAERQSQGQQTSDPLSLPAEQWAKAAAQNEVKIVRYNSPYLRYRIHQIDAKGDQTRDVIESKDGTVARLIKRSGKPLTPEQDAAERSRLQAMVNSPDAFAKHIKSDVTGKKTAVDLLGVMPDAMTYSYASGQPQRPGMREKPNGMREVVLDFKPNPKWKPPTLESEALTGLEGRLWIDTDTRVVTRMEGRLVHAVNFGWGLFARLYPGGTVTVEQAALPDNRFIITHFIDDITLRAMMVKTIKVHSDISAFGFAPIGELTYQQAIRALLASPLSSAD